MLLMGYIKQRDNQENLTDLRRDMILIIISFSSIIQSEHMLVKTTCHFTFGTIPIFK